MSFHDELDRIEEEIEREIEMESSLQAPVLASDMTLLDWFAGEALTGLAANPVKYNGKPYEYAHDAFQFAEAMMLERKRRAGK